MTTDINITDTGVIQPDTSEIYTEVSTDWNLAFGGDMQTEESTPQGQLITSLTTEIDNKNNNLVNIINQINPKTNSGIWQDAIGYIFFLERKLAESSIVTCQCVGLSGTVIPAGSTIKNTNGDLFTSNDEATIPLGGTVDVSFSSVENGAISVNSNTLTSIVSTISGWDSVDNASAGSIGRDVETRAEFEARRELSVAKNSSGTISSIYSNVSNIEDVLDVYAQQNRTNTTITVDTVDILPNSVYTSVLGGDTQEIAEAIESVLSAGCGTIGNTSYDVIIPDNGVIEEINFQRPIAKGVKIEVKLNSTPTTPVDIADTIKDIVFNNFYGLDGINSRVKMGQDLYASRFYSGVATIDGINVISIEIAYIGDSLGDSIYVPIINYATLDKNDITVTVV